MENEDIGIKKEKLLVKKFEALFKMHGYNTYDSFDNKVWFIKENSHIQSYLNEETPEYMDISYTSRIKPKIIEVLTKCNNSRVNKANLTKMNINVREFIDTLANTLFEIHSSIEISEENIIKNDSLVKVAKIGEIISLLKSKISTKSKVYYESKMIAVLTSVTNFPLSPYKAMLLLNTATDNNSEPIQDLFQEELFTLNTLIDINQANDTIILRNSKKMNKSNYAFQQYSFGILENDDTRLLVDKRMNGTTLSNFKLRLQGKNGVIESNIEYFLHLILTSVDDLCDLTKDIWTKSCVLKMNDNKKSQDNSHRDIERSVGVDFIIELDDLTRIGILRRIKELISIPIDTKTKYLMDIDEIITDYFPEIKDSVMNILTRQEDNRNNCCAECVIV